MNYVPTFPDGGITAQWLYDELQRISTSMTTPEFVMFQVLHSEPARPSEGTVAYADGVDWNPTGAGGGLHQYISGVWDKL